MVRLLPFVLVAALAAVPAVASALGLSATGLGAGSAATSGCEGDGVVLGYSHDSAGRLTAVRIGDIDTDCAGATVRLTLLAGASVAAEASQSLPEAGFTGTLDLSLADLPLADEITRADVAIEGR